MVEELLAAAVLPFFYGHNNVRHLVRYESIAGAPTMAKGFPIAGELAAQALTEGVDAAYTQYSTGTVRSTASAVGVVLGITDLLEASDIFSGLGHYAEQAGMALANKVTTDILALNAGFSNVTGTTTADLTEANILNGVQLLAAGGIPGPYNGCLHPIQWYDLAGSVGSFVNPAGTTGANSVAETNTWGAAPAFGGGIEHLYGVNWSINSNDPSMAAGADRAGVVLNPMYGIGFVEKWGARVETQRDASALLSEIVVTACYGVTELRDAAGVTIQTDL